MKTKSQTRIGLAIAAAVLMAWETHALIFFSTGVASHNSTPPGGTFANSGWQWQGSWGGFLGTPIGPHHFITAAHVLRAAEAQGRPALGGPAGKELPMGAAPISEWDFFDDLDIALLRSSRPLHVTCLNEWLQTRVQVLEEDYRDLEGKFDKLVSVEMIEAVGHEYFDTFFRKTSSLLRPDGMMLVQGIVIKDQFFAAHRHSADFIRQHIFPGGCLPSVTALCESMTRASDLRLIHLEEISDHYARTLRHWRKRFWTRVEDVRELGYSERFIRKWEYYLRYCEAAFEERQVNVVQMLLAKPDCRLDPLAVPLPTVQQRPQEAPSLVIYQ